MSLSRLLAWCLGGLLVAAALAVLLARGMARPAYSPAEVAAIDSAWQQVLELAREPAPPPADVVVAADFRDDLEAFDGDRDGAHLEAFADWLSGDGPHRLRGPGDAPSAWPLPLLHAGQQLAEQGDPTALPGLLALAHGLRTEGHVLDQMVGTHITSALLDRLDGAPDDPALAPVRAAAAAWAPTQDEVERTLARDAVALVAQLSEGTTTITSTGGPRPLTTTTSDLPAEVMATALRQAALTALAPGPPPPRPGVWDAVTTFLFSDTTLVERQLATLIAPSRTALEASHGDLRRRWTDVLGDPPDEQGGEATHSGARAPGSAPSPAADGPLGG